MSAGGIGHRARFRALFVAVAVLALAAACDEKLAEFFSPGEFLDPSRGDLIGRVTQGGQGVPGAAITVRRNGQTIGSATTDASGNYEVLNLEPGPAEVSVTPPSGLTCSGPQTRTIVEDEETRADFTCQAPVTTGTVTGAVTSGGSPVSGATVAIGTRTTTTNASGQYTLTEVPSGTQTLTTTASGQTCPNQTVTVVAGQSATANVPCTATVVPGSIDVGVTVGGSPAAGVAITVRQGGTVVATGTTAANGRFVFTGRAPGAYEVSIAPPTGATCPGAQAATVTAGGTAIVNFPCTVSQSTVPAVGEVPGNWSYIRMRTGTVGGCIGAIPTSGTGTIANPSGNSLSILDGMHPDIDFSGTYNPSTGGYTGTGSQALQNGFTLMGNVAGTFRRGTGGGIEYTDQMTVQHVFGGSTVCTETYTVTGTRQTSTSSRRFKTDVVALLPGGATVFGLAPVAFRYVAPYGDPATARVGLLAEDVVRVYPEAVVLDGAGLPAAIDYARLTGLVVRAIEARLAEAVREGVARAAAAP